MGRVTRAQADPTGPAGVAKRARALKPEVGSSSTIADVAIQQVDELWLPSNTSQIGAPASNTALRSSRHVVTARSHD